LSTQGDIFAFGAVVYEIMSEAPPLAGLSGAEINSRYNQGEFADTALLGEMGTIIRKCWTGQYTGFAPLAQDLLQRCHVPSTSCYLSDKGSLTSSSTK